MHQVQRNQMGTCRVSYEMYVLRISSKRLDIPFGPLAIPVKSGFSSAEKHKVYLDSKGQILHHNVHSTIWVEGIVGDDHYAISLHRERSSKGAVHLFVPMAPGPSCFEIDENEIWINKISLTVMYVP